MYAENVNMQQFYIDKTLYTGRPEDKRTPAEERVYDALETLGIHFTRVDHDAANTIVDCIVVEQMLGGRICKNLFLCNRAKTAYFLLLMPGDKPFKTKDLTPQIPSGRVSFASGEDMERMLCCSPGSASVMGLLFDRSHDISLLIDRELLSDESFCCHPCKNTSSLKIAMEDVLQVFLPHCGHKLHVVDLSRYE